MTKIEWLIVGTIILFLKIGLVFGAETVTDSLASRQLVIAIQNKHNSFQGRIEEVSIIKMSGDVPISGFDFRITYESGAVQLIDAKLGKDFGKDGCNWQFFSYDNSTPDDSRLPCAEILHLVAKADTTSGKVHQPGCNIPDGAVLVKFTMMLPADPAYGCEYLPMRFVWRGCHDNEVSIAGGDTTLIFQDVLDPGSMYSWRFPHKDLSKFDCNSPVRFLGPCSSCDDSLTSVARLREIKFGNGGVDLVCAESVTARGDMNSNGIANEIADAEVFTKYFLYGESSLDTSLAIREALDFQGDANNDGNSMTVGDMVYLWRIITGDALPFAKLHPYQDTARVTFRDGTFRISSPVGIAGVAVEFESADACSAASLTRLKLDSHYDSTQGRLRVVVTDNLSNLRDSLPAGVNEIFRVPGKCKLKRVQVADYNGNQMGVTLDGKLLVSNFALLRPAIDFAAKTATIAFDLPEQRAWSVTVTNLKGDSLKEFKGNDNGHVEVVWNIAGQRCGTYYFIINAGSFKTRRTFAIVQ